MIGTDKIISNEQTEYTNLLEAYNKKQAAEAQAQAKASKKNLQPHMIGDRAQWTNRLFGPKYIDSIFLV